MRQSDSAQRAARKRSFALALLILFAAGVGLAVFLLRDRDARDHDPIRAHEAPELATERSEELLADLGQSAEARSAPSAGAEQSEKQNPPPEVAPSQPEKSPGLTLRVKLLGSCLTEGSATVSAALAPWPNLRREARLGAIPGEAVLDLASLSRDFFALRGGLIVSARAAGCAAADVLVTPADAVADPDDATAFLIEVTLELGGGTTVTGRVVDGLGRPVHQASVVLTESEVVESAASARIVATTKEDGSFEATSGYVGPAWLHAYHEQVGTCAPTAVSLVLGRTDLGTIELRGNSLSGVVLPAAPECPLEGLTVVLRTLGGSNPFVLGASAVTAIGGGLESSSRQTRTDANGRFRFDGLSNREYQLYCQGPDSASSAPGIRNSTLRVTPPKEDVVLIYDTPLLILDVRGEEGPLPRATCMLHVGDFSGRGRANEEGRIYYGMPPGLTPRVVVENEGYLPRELSIDGPQIGKVEHHIVVLERGPAPAQLTLQVAFSDRGPAQHVAIGFQDLERAEALRYRGMVSSTGEFPCTVEPGRYRVNVRDGDWQQPSSLYDEQTFEINLAAGEVARREVTLEAAGRLRLRIVDAAGRLVDAECELVGPDGAVRQVTYGTVDEGLNVWYESPTRPHRGVQTQNSWADVYPGLAPGEYTLRMRWNETERDERQVFVTLGRVVPVEITLGAAGD